MNTNSFLKNFFLALTVVFFASCDSDFNEIGSDVLGNDLFNLSHETIPVIAYNQKTDAVSTSNLPTNLLGIRQNPFFGKTTANFVTQLSLAALSPVFGANVEIDSVVLSVPYFLKTAKTITNSDLSRQYTLDSIYGTSPINLKVFENGYYLRDFDPVTKLGRYFSNQDSEFSNVKIGNALNNGVISENTSFLPRKSEFIKFKVNQTDELISTVDGVENYKRKYTQSTNIIGNVETRSVPKMHLSLNKEYFKTKIIEASPSKLASNVAFKEYLRGLYFQIEDKNTPDQTMMSLDFSKGDVTIYYSEDNIVASTEFRTVAGILTLIRKSTNERTKKTLVMNMTGNTANFFDTSGAMSEYTNALISPNRIVGDEKIYLKGGQGSQTFIELNNDALIGFRNKNYLINQATLTFTIDNATMAIGNPTKVEPQRIFVFDADNNTPLIDYAIDQTTNSTDTKLSKYIHNGIIQKDSDKRGTKYVIDITQHITDIIKKDSTNVRLGVIVTEGISVLGNSFLKTKIIDPSPINSARTFDRLPRSSVMSSLGTILFGNIPSTSADYEKRLKFEIYYTKPKQN